MRYRPDSCDVFIAVLFVLCGLVLIFGDDPACSVTITSTETTEVRS